jgi:hypothetical protein
MRANTRTSILVSACDLVTFGEAFLVFAWQALFPSNPTLKSHPTHLRGLFGIKAGLKTAPEDVKPRINSNLRSAWKIDVDGDVALMQCLVPYDPEKKQLVINGMIEIEEDMTQEKLEQLTWQGKIRSPAESFWRASMASKAGKSSGNEIDLVQSIFCRTLEEYMRPFKLPTHDEKWGLTCWPPKKAVNELCAQLGLRATHLAVARQDIGEEAYVFMEKGKMFYTKLELAKIGVNMEEILPETFMASTGPFRTKNESQDAACIQFLSDYHDSYIARNNPSLYETAKDLFAAQEEEASEDSDIPTSADSSSPSTTITSTSFSIPELVKRPSLDAWKSIPQGTKIDIFGNGNLEKCIVNPGDGPLLGVSCMLRVWVSIRSEGDACGLEQARFEEMVIGGMKGALPIPIACLMSMRVGESALFHISGHIASQFRPLPPPREDLTPSWLVQDKDEDVDNESDVSSSPSTSSTSTSAEKPVMMIGLSIPPYCTIVSAHIIPTLASASTPIEPRVQYCKALNQDAVALYNNRHFKMALDYYQLGLRELSVGNPMFVDRSNILQASFTWSPEYEEFKAEFIRNRLGCAACCLYLEEWPHHVPGWRNEENAIQEGLAAVNSVRRLDPTNFTALRRRALLYLKSNRFEEATEDLIEAAKLPGGSTDEAKRMLAEDAKNLATRKLKSQREAEEIGKRMWR